MTGDAQINVLSDPLVDSTTGRPWANGSTGWRVFRGVLIVCWLILMTAVVVVGERSSSYAQLKDDVAAGHVHTVRIAGELRPRESGRTLVELHWRRGPFNYTTDVIAARPRSRAPRHPATDSATAVIRGNVGARLTALQPDLHVVHVRRTDGYASLWGWRLPEPLGGAALAVGFGALVLLAFPDPWRATRWAWFWLIMLAAPLGIPAFLFLSGPARPLPAPRPGAKVLTGGRAILLGAVLGWALTHV